MKKFLIVKALGLAFSMASLSWTAAAADFSDVTAKIDKTLKDAHVNKSEFGILVADIDGTTPVYELNSKKKMVPASITKVATSAMVLANIPPGTKIKTSLLMDSVPHEKVVHGSLYLRGGGDPSFVAENMWVLVNNFVRTGVRTIDGDIVVDDSLFDAERFDESREDKRVDRAYDAPTGAMSFNWNSVNVYVRPTASGESAHVFADPENDYIQLHADVKTNSGSGHTVQVDRKAGKGNLDLLSVGGKIGASAKEIVVYKNISKPDLWSGYNLQSFLHQRGIEVKGTIRNGVTPASAEVVAESESKPIEQILADMNKFSNNYVAEMLSKLAASRVQKPGSIAKAMDMIKQYLLKLGIPEDQIDLQNPSGFTRENHITADAMWKVMADLRRQFQYQPEFLSSLPIAGIDGTLKKRMKEGPAERQIRAKTGSLNGVVSLAGYAGRKDGTVWPFVMMYNGSEDESSIRALFDKICVRLVE